ncbi:MAG: ABC transporter ATP-binding protein [Candidatus Moranbacteria bacterium RIFOXYA12_FULL_35_19]|nr:MAG: ABC transporter related-protein [Candidatus Moranbacteria bacterium GW2011_GWF2_35_39]OGI32725.1 MAG: ABC transporter ATP-binding protein [Candidatus Moranbacteria bacterium RIFOXYB12_FULL_35_8]OGI32974.1 MAG: ABC transporter ATP-binding protein [Candidatus Moranbacteria bacterium RIFOXYC12_FULL_36_13]OGI36715.1 MAG: ABC transporter ATP-binding protein [Candidatus Moranbacteria bacterium RIFOXYA12_FULL_35_19]
MLKIVNLNSGYNKTKILHGVYLEINPKEIVVLIGPNGAGKSTALKSIFSLADVYSGKIIFKDIDITDLKTHELISLGISFVPQGRQVFSNMTVLENLEMGAFTINDQDIVKRSIENIFKKFTILEKKQNALAGNLSGGQQQLLAIARALIQNPQILLLDEPSLGLDPKTMKEVFEKIVEIKNEGISVLMVEQNAKQAVEIADRTYILENGTIAVEGGKDILKNKKIKDIYFGGGASF